MITWLTNLFSSRQRKLEQQAKLVYDNTFQFIGLCLPDGTVKDINATALNVYNLSLEDVEGKYFWDTPWWSNQISQQQLLQAFEKIHSTKKMVRMHTIHPLPNGDVMHIDFSLMPILDEKDNIKYVIPEGREETEYHNVIRGFKTNQLSTTIGFTITDLETGHFIQVNDAFCDMVGFAEEELLNMTYWCITPEEYNEKEEEQIEMLTATGGYGPYEKEYLHKEGQRIPVVLSGVVNISPNTEKKTVWSIVHDMTPQRENDRLIFDLSFYDHLTDLPNRAHGIKYIAHLLETKKQKHISLVLIDIDDFKKINDTHGYSIGDATLQVFSKRLLDFVQSYCNNVKGRSGFCAKIGGDEFIVVVGDENVRSKKQIEFFVEKIYEQFDSKLDIDGISLNINMSIGISTYPKDGNDVSTLIKSADLALHTARKHGKGKYSFYTDAIKAEFDQLVEYENAIEYFVETEDFQLHFQPILDLKTKTPVGAECLFRGNEEKFGKLNLDLLFTIAEQTGYIIPLGEAIFRQACKRCSECTFINDQRFISVNVSPKQIEHPDFLNMCCKSINEFNIKPQNIAIELTEHVMLNETHDVINKLNHMRGHGMQVFIDDFGKGYSSLSYLRLLPVDKIKIDRLFTEGVGTDISADEMIAAINSVSHVNGQQTCAEGVEMKHQLLTLMELGVDQAQGFFISHPLSFDELKQYMLEQRWLSLWESDPENS